MHMMHALMHMHGDGGAAPSPGEPFCVAVTVAEASYQAVSDGGGGH